MYEPRRSNIGASKEIVGECKYIETNELNFSDVLSKWKLHWVASKVDMNPFAVHSLCTRPKVVYTSINLRKMTFIPEVITLSHMALVLSILIGRH